MSEGGIINVGAIGPSLLCGGAERWIYNLVRHCSADRIRWVVNVVAYPHVEPMMLSLMSASIPTYCEGRCVFHGNSREMSLDQAIAELCEHSDIVLAWELDHDLIEKLGGHNRKVVNVLQRNDPKLKSSLRPEHFVVAVSPLWHELSPSDLGRITIIPNGIELDRCTATSGRDEIRSQWGIGNETLAIGYIGRVSHEKNCPALARALCSMQEDAVGIIYGSSTDQSKSIIQQMLTLAGDRLRIFPPTERVGNVLNALDVFIMPSHTEACPLALLEAFAAKVPVVITANRFIDDVEKEYGRLVERMVPNAAGEEIAQAILRAAHLSEETLNKARDIVFNHYSARIVADRWERYIARIFDQLTSEQRRGQATLRREE